MESLFEAYSNASEDDEDEPQPKRLALPSSPSKRPKPERSKFPPKFQPSPSPDFNSEPQKGIMVPGRYVSKRERALLGAAPVSTAPDSFLNPSVLSSTVGNLSDSDLPRDILSLLRSRAKDCLQQGMMPERMSVTLDCHTKAVNALQWSPSNAHLLASAAMDHTICVWNVWNTEQKLAFKSNIHNAAVKNVQWSQEGLSILSCGYDRASRLIDVEKGTEVGTFKEDQGVAVVKFHPNNPNLFLSGGLKGSLRMWDTRIGKVVNKYNRRLGPILDVEFTPHSNQFISSSDVSASNSSESSIIVWDITREVPLSYQVYMEAYTCPCVRCHPFDPVFIAQSNGDYVAIFSLNPPFKLDKYKRYESHGVSGFPIKCNFSLDTKQIISGSSDGSVYFYDYKSSLLVRKQKAFEHACIDVAIHPILPNVIASCSWNGNIAVFQ
ncbi:WD repeat-containing protein 25 [Momordica charantia]|uniref:WD repeat-containing protein 25 n=1 Tax=Momordica charantia TaxID=3673 RepID=A0A6J1CMQ5_MOMCH|nr:WD repeat-containing protein 25 [Momordica charantia]